MIYRRIKYFGVILFFLAANLNLQAREYMDHPDPKELANWKLLGKGTVEIIDEGNILKITEGSDSKGIVLLSPQKYSPNTVISFMFKPLQHKGIGVVLHSISDINKQQVKTPINYDGNLNYWRSKKSNIQNYIFTFHTAFHQKNLQHAPYPVALLRRNPGFTELGKGKDIVTDEKWYSIEVGRHMSTLWLSVDDILVFKVNDPGPELPGGHIGLRLRGPGDGSFSSLYKNFVIKIYPEAE